MAERRVPTGIPGLDEILQGGWSHSASTCGWRGSCKTVFSVQWLLEGHRRNERLLYITLTEPASDIKRNMASFGWQFGQPRMLCRAERKIRTE